MLFSGWGKLGRMRPTFRETPVKLTQPSPLSLIREKAVMDREIKKK
jgi:hypothetical protein